jgi:uncharacterized metal-binding protein
MSGCNCSNSEKSNLIYSCSGAADVGKLSDKLARYLAKSGWGKMTCLAAVGAELSGFVESAKSIGENILIDGCSVACGKKIFDKLNLPYTSIILTDMGCQKGKTEVNEDLVDKLSKEIMCK